MKILLILPAPVRIKYNISGVYPLPPLGIAYIAAILEKNNFDVEILDMSALKTKIKDLPGLLTGYSVYGISCNIFNLNHGIDVSRAIKKINPSSKVVLGGRCTAFPPESILRRFDTVDFIIKGEGEKTMLGLCSALKEGRDVRLIEGLSYREGSSIINNNPPPPIDLNTLLLPARHLLPNKKYKMHPPFGIYPPVTLIETSRGCNYGCRFCGMQREVRERSAENVVAEIRECIDKLKVKEIHFVDPNFTYNQKRIIDLCNQLIKENIRINWTCKTRVDLVSEELLRAMSKAGCYMVSFGVESGSQEILNSLNKNIKVRDIETAIRLCKKAGIRTIAYMLLGSPGETNETLKETVNFVEKIDPDFVLFGELLPDPNSSLMEDTGENKTTAFDKLLDFYMYNKYPDPSKNTICDIPREDIKRWLDYANRRFYLRGKYILKRLFLIKNFNEIIILVKGALFLMLDKIKELSKPGELALPKPKRYACR